MTRWRNRVGGDGGLGLILVMGITALVTTLVATAGVIAVNALKQSNERSKFERSMAVAEVGVDFALARLQRAYDVNNADYPIPAASGSSCTAPPVTAPTAFNSEEAERSWAKTQLSTLLATHPECVQTVPGGEFLVLKPQTPLDENGYYGGYGRIYSMGWSPDRASAGARARLLKTEYVFMPYRGSNAILTQGDLDISASTTVTVASGFDPTTAAVHANGTITTVGNPTVFGSISSVQPSTANSTRFYNNPGGAVALGPTQSLPRVDAASLYRHVVVSDPAALADWTDLCPDGTARAYSADGPCTSSSTKSLAQVGWSYDSGSHTWTASRFVDSGVYYAHQANIVSDVGVATIPNLTLIAAAENNDTCTTKQYGNIDWDRYDPDAPAFTNLFMYADADIRTGANFNAGSIGGAGVAPVSGMFVAGDQVQLETSSSGAVGSVLASDQCGTSQMVLSNQVKNPTVYYDPQAEAPFSSIVSTTLWLEYPA